MQSTGGRKWLEIAENLPVGHKARAKCDQDCGQGDTLSITHDTKRFWCSCFRCGHSDQHDKGQQTLGELKRIRDLNEQAASLELTLELPHDFTNDIPSFGRMWLFKAGITESVYREYNIGYSKSLDRVVLPVYNTEGTLEWYQCRALHTGQSPKYLQPARDRSTVLFHGRKGTKDLQRAVIVEDILSAIRVGKHADSYSLLGTKITTEQAAFLSTYPRVTTWLDPDKAGKVGAYKIRRVLGLVTDVDNVVTSTDPKDLSDKEIRKQLSLT